MEGLYQAIPTGEVLEEEDSTLIQIKLGGKLTYARVSMPFGTYHVPSKKWLEKYIREFVCWVAYEHGDGSWPVVVGYSPLKNKIPGENYPEMAVWKTEKFKEVYDDVEETYTGEWSNGNKIEHGPDFFRFTHKDGRVLEMREDMISLGAAEESAEPAVLGDKNRVALEEIVNKTISLLDRTKTLAQNVQTAASTQAGVASGLPYLTPLAGGFTTLATAMTTLMAGLDTLKGQMTQLKNNEIPATLSEKVTLD